METNRIIGVIDEEIIRLQQVRALLGGAASGRKPGRPKGSGSKAGKRRMSAEGRKRIAEAQRKRWAAAKAEKSGKK